VARRIFTVEQARALLPELTPLLAELSQAKRAVDVLQSELASLIEKTRGNGHRVDHERISTIRRDVASTTETIRALAARVTDYGCELKDLEMGLIDFPAERDGRIVYLCWRLGEAAIDYWHELDAGYGGRQPL
jgi:hypothetical protein